MALPLPVVDRLINEIRLERHWKDDGAVNIDEFSMYIRKKLYDWAQPMTRLCSEKQYDDHAKIITEIVELRAHLANIFPKNVDTFVTDVFHVGPYRVVTEHYFSPQPFYPNDSTTTLRKHVKFTVGKSANQVDCRYFLRSTEFFGLLYILGRSSVDYEHNRQIREYLYQCPTYSQMKDDVIENITADGC